MESPLCPPDDPDFRLIETLYWAPDTGARHRDLHLSRLATSAARLGIPATHAAPLLDRFSAQTPQRLRLTLDTKGQAALTHADHTPHPANTLWALAWAAPPIMGTDPWLAHKTTNRARYDRDRANLPAGIDEYLYINTQGRATEGTITNLFADLGQGLLTPPCADGCLPGVLRAHLLATGQAQIHSLTPDDIANAKALFMGNSLRGLIPATLKTP